MDFLFGHLVDFFFNSLGLKLVSKMWVTCQKNHAKEINLLS